MQKVRASNLVVKTILNAPFALKYSYKREKHRLASSCPNKTESRKYTARNIKSSKHVFVCLRVHDLLICNWISLTPPACLRQMGMPALAEFSHRNSKQKICTSCLHWRAQFQWHLEWNSSNLSTHFYSWQTTEFRW